MSCRGGRAGCVADRHARGCGGSGRIAARRHASARQAAQKRPRSVNILPRRMDLCGLSGTHPLNTFGLLSNTYFSEGQARLLRAPRRGGDPWALDLASYSSLSARPRRAHNVVAPLRLHQAN